MYSKIDIPTPIGIIVENLVQAISLSHIAKKDQKVYIERLLKIDFQLFESAYQNTQVKISGRDMKYIICFAVDIDVKDISLLFNIEPASVHTARYRIKKKFAKNDSFRMIL